MRRRCYSARAGRRRDRSGDAATSTSTPAGGASAGGIPCTRGAGARSSRTPRHHERLQRLERGAQLVALDGACGIDVLRTDHATLADEGAPPDPLVLGQDLESFRGALVARIEVVALGEGDRGRPDELRVEAVDRAGGVAQHAVDAHAELLVLVHLIRRLPVFALGQWLLLGADEPRLDPRQLPHEVADLDDQVANDGKVAQRLYAHGARGVVRQEGGARQLRLAVDGHAAAPTDAHPARPAVRERSVQLVLDEVEAVKDHPVLRAGYLVLLVGDAGLLLRTIARHLQSDPIRHKGYLPYTRSPGGQRVIVTGT